MDDFGTTGLNYSAGDMAWIFALALVFAFIGYRTSHRFRTVVGVTPWRIPSIVWAAICFFLQPIGVIIEWVAEFTTRPAVGFTRPNGPAGVAQPQARAPMAPVSTPIPAPPSPLQPAPPRFAPPLDEHGRNALFGWYKDVTGRHELRYWDGRHWSDHVRDGGASSSDPLGS